jgi:hypothetical protein
MKLAHEQVRLRRLGGKPLGRGGGTVGLIGPSKEEERPGSLEVVLRDLLERLGGRIKPSEGLARPSAAKVN